MVSDVDADPDLYDRLQQASFIASTKATADSLDRRMTGAAIAGFLDEKRYCTVATTRADGRPHAAMTGFLVHDGAVWMPVMAGTARAANIGRQPYAVIVVNDAEGDEHVMVTLEGAASVVEELRADVHEVWTRRAGADPEWATAWIRVSVERLFSYAGPASGRETGST